MSFVKDRAKPAAAPVAPVASKAPVKQRSETYRDLSAVGLSGVLRRVEAAALAKLGDESPELAEMADLVIIDPGEDLSPDDAHLWLWLLSQAEQVSPNMRGILWYLRGGGARLVPSPRYGFIIQPIIDETGERGWKSKDEYNREKTPLAAWTKQLLELLESLGNIEKNRLRDENSSRSKNQLCEQSSLI